jgi:biopolymer transport protein ExbD
MGGISSGDGGGHGGKKSVDHEIPLIPFIDLLLCCVMFLLVTAVWNKLARLDTNLSTPGAMGEPQEEEEERPEPVLVHIESDMILIGEQGSVADPTEIPNTGTGQYNLVDLRNRLDEYRRADPNRSQAQVSSDDGIRYADIVAVMDQVLGAGFGDMSLQPQSRFPTQ